MQITNAMRDALLAHLDRFPVPYRVRNPRHRTISILLQRRLIRFGPARRHTIITEAGRQLLAELLAEYAETLVRAGFAEAELIVPRLPYWWPNKTISHAIGVIQARDSAAFDKVA